MIQTELARGRCGIRVTVVPANWSVALSSKDCVMSYLSQFVTVKRLALLAMALVTALPAGARADVINVDVSGVDPRFQFLFTEAEAFWESRIQSWSDDLPSGFRSRLGSLQIFASTGQIDGVGGAVGGAAVTSTASWRETNFFNPNPRTWVVPQSAIMQFDLADLDNQDPNDPLGLTLEDFSNTIIHEMGHAMGFGSLWEDNGFLGAAINGQTEFIHNGYAIQEYRAESNNRFASFIPIEQQGGAGTALSHWSSEDPFFNQLDTTGRTETMLGFIFNLDSNGNLINGDDFVSETTWGSLADIGWEVAGINDNTLDDTFRRPFQPKEFGPSRPFFFRSLTSVPEPGSTMALLALGVVALGYRRRR